LCKLQMMYREDYKKRRKSEKKGKRREKKWPKGIECLDRLPLESCLREELEIICQDQNIPINLIAFYIEKNIIKLQSWARMIAVRRFWRRKRPGVWAGFGLVKISDKTLRWTGRYNNNVPNVTIWISAFARPPGKIQSISIPATEILCTKIKHPPTLRRISYSFIKGYLRSFSR
jgi:hypothetical protein